MGTSTFVRVVTVVVADVTVTPRADDMAALEDVTKSALSVAAPEMLPEQLT